MHKVQQCGGTNHDICGPVWVKNKPISVPASVKPFYTASEKGISSIEKKYPIIVIENSLNHKLKNELEEKYDNVKVIIPPKNIGISAGYNLGIRESKTNFVKLTSADIHLTDKCLEDLEDCVFKMKNFAMLAPTYDDETIYKNYRIWNPENLSISFTDQIFEKYNVR